MKWEYNPTADLSLWALSFCNTSTDDEARQTDLLIWNTSTAISNQTATAGTLTNNSMLQQHYLGKFDFERTIGGIQTGSVNAIFQQRGGRSALLNFSADGPIDRG